MVGEAEGTTVGSESAAGESFQVREGRGGGGQFAGGKEGGEMWTWGGGEGHVPMLSGGRWQGAGAMGSELAAGQSLLMRGEGAGREERMCGNEGGGGTEHHVPALIRRRGGGGAGDAPLPTVGGCTASKREMVG